MTPASLREKLRHCPERVRIVPYYNITEEKRKPGHPEGDKSLVEKTTGTLKEAVFINAFAPHLSERWKLEGSVVFEEASSLKDRWAPRKPFQQKNTLCAESPRR